MRAILFVLLFIIGAAGCAGSKEMYNDFVKLNGTWLPVNQEIGGKQLPKAVYENQKLIMNEGEYTVHAESADKGFVKLDNDRMDIFGKDGPNKGKHFTAIYKLEDGLLTICYNLKGDSYPAKFDTQGKPLYFLSVFKKDSGK